MRHRWPGIVIALLLPAVTMDAASFNGTIAFDQAPPPAVLVWLPEDHGWTLSAPVVIDQRDQVFQPVIAVAPSGAQIQVRNGDAVRHNVFSLAPEQDLGLGDPGSVLDLPVSWPNGSVVRHGCKIHPQMRLWVAALDTVHHRVVTFTGVALTADFTLPDIPPGTTRLAFWSPRGEPAELAVEDREKRQAIMRQGVAIGALTVRRIAE